MVQKHFTDLERLEVVAKRIRESQVDLTTQYSDWVNITLACASLGEGAREAYHDICSIYPGYDRKECDEKFDNCLKSGRGMLTLGTLMQAAKDAGIDINMPSGRRPKSQAEQEEEQRNRMSQMAEMLKQQAEWRYNTWRQRPEVKEDGQEWRPVQDRDLDTFYCRLCCMHLSLYYLLHPSATASVSGPSCMHPSFYYLLHQKRQAPNAK